MPKKRHPRGTCIVCDLNRLDEEKPPRPAQIDGGGQGETPGNSTQPDGPEDGA